MWLTDLLTGFFKFVFKYIFMPFLFPILFMIVSEFIYQIIKGERFKKGAYKNIGIGKLYGGAIYKLLVAFPRQFVQDQLHRNPEALREFGLWCICGEQGSGKNMTAAYLLKWFQARYEKVIVGSNIDFDSADYNISSFDDFINTNNGVNGNVALLDEAHLLFNNLGVNAKNFDENYLAEVCMQRKQRKVCFMLSQQFNRLNIVCRQNCFRLFEPHTFFNCLTIVFQYKLKTEADGQTVNKKFQRVFFFVHNDELRNSYDSYALVDKLAVDGFKEKSDSIVTPIVLESPKSKR
jgi:hypothetical protein